MKEGSGCHFEVLHAFEGTIEEGKCTIGGTIGEGLDTILGMGVDVDGVTMGSLEGEDIINIVVESCIPCCPALAMKFTMNSFNWAFQRVYILASYSFNLAFVSTSLSSMALYLYLNLYIFVG